MLALFTILPRPAASIGSSRTLVEQPAGELTRFVDQHVDPPAAELGQEASISSREESSIRTARTSRAPRSLTPREVSRVAHAGQQVNIALGELLNQRAADAAVGPGYENAESGKVHGRTDSRFGPC